MNTDDYTALYPTEHEDYLVDLLLARTRTYLAQEALKEIEPEDFSSPMLAAIWQAAKHLEGNGQMITQRGLRSGVLLALPEGRDGRRDTTVLDRRLGRIASAVVPVDLAPEAFRVVREMGQMRRMYESAGRMQQRILEAAGPSEAMVAITEEVDSLDKTVVTSTGPRLAHLAGAQFVDDMRGQVDKVVIPTPWMDLNGMFGGGLEGGRLYVLGGRPGDGKSLAGMAIAGAAAAEHNPTLAFSAEMDHMEVVGRWIAREAGIDLGEIQRRDLSDWSWQQYEEFKARAADIPLWIDDRAGIGVPYIKTVARQMVRKHNINLVVVDYLQLLSSENTKAPRHVQVGEMSRALKHLARELCIPIVALAQLNRGAVDKVPSMSDLRESGDIEQDADGIVLIERPRDEAGQHTSEVVFHVVKNRHGRTGRVDLSWRGYRADITA